MNRLVTFLTTVLLIFLISDVALAQRPESIQENLIVSAVQKYNEGNYDAADSILDNILQEDSRNDAAWYYSALVSLAQNDIAAAEDYLKSALEIDPDNFWYRYRLAGIYAVTSRTELTIDIYERLLEDFPQKSDLYFDLSELYSAQNEFEKALLTLDEIENVVGVSESIAVYRFNLLRRMNRIPDAYASLEEYNKKYSSPYILATLADYQISMYNDSTALAYYNEALDIAPDYTPALLGKAEVLRMTRRYDEYFDALNLFVGAADAPTQGKCDYLMAVIQRTDPKFVRNFIPQLDTAMVNLLLTHPTDSTALQTAGTYYYSTGRIDKAKTCFEINRHVYPQSFSANASLVEFLMYAEMWEDLSREGRLAFERFPNETAFIEMAGVGDYNLVYTR